MRRATFQCVGSRTRLVGWIGRLNNRGRVVFFASSNVWRVLLGTCVVGKLSRRRGQDVISVEGSNTELVGKLTVAF